MKATFKTGYNQRELVLDVQVAADMAVGTVVSLSGTGDAAKITEVASGTAPANTHYIVAQSDMTMGNKRDYSKHEYEYSDIVKKTDTGVLKKVALFAVVDVNDVIYK